MNRNLKDISRIRNDNDYLPSGSDIRFLLRAAIVSETQYQAILCIATLCSEKGASDICFIDATRCASIPNWDISAWTCILSKMR